MNTSKRIPTSQGHARWLPALSGRTTFALLLTAALALTGTARAQSPTLTDIGTTAPTLGPDDVYQLTGGSGDPPGLNYYYNNGNPPGQTFTTGSNPNGYLLNTVSIMTAGNGSLPPAGQAFTLRIYSVAGTTATLLATYVSQSGFVFAEYDWLQWTNLGIVLSANTQYAYTLHNNGSGWERLANMPGDLYTGGQAALIPSAGGTITFSTTAGYDATFAVGLTAVTELTVNPPTIAPASAVVAGKAVTLSVAASGPAPFYYQWQTDGGTGGALTNIPGATAATLPVNTTNLSLGNFAYDVVVTNSTTSVTSSVVTLTIIPPAVPATLTDLGGNSPLAGANDIVQLTGGTGGNVDDLNYYDDNGAAHGDMWTGQTFTTGTNTQGYYLSSVAIQTGGGGSSGTGTAQPYELFIFSIESGNAKTIAHFSATNFAFTFGDWVQWSGFSLVLKSNATYAYGFGNDRTNSSFQSWAALAASPPTTDVYAGGQIALIPANGGPLSFGTTGLADAVFDAGLQPIGVGPDPKPFATPIIVSPSRTLVAGTQMTLNEAATGNAPLHYVWRTDGGNAAGSLTNIPSSDVTNLVVNTTGFKPGPYRYDVVVNNTYGSATSTVATVTIVYADGGAVLTDIGVTMPTPADTAISQLITGGVNSPDSLNYYFDNGSPPGQTFTTGSNPGGYTLTTLSVFNSGNNGGLPPGGQAYVLRLYTVSDSAATLYATYTSQNNFVFASGDWLRWSGLTVPLANNTTYAYTFAKVASGGGWGNLGNVGGNPYAQGEVVLISPGGGSITFGSSHDFDASFVVGLAQTGSPYVAPPTFSPSNTVYAGTPVTVSATVTGTGPFTYQWQTDGGNAGGSLTNIPGAINPTLLADTSPLGGLTVSYRLVATNGSGSTTGEAAILTVNAGSPPFVSPGFDTTPSSASRFIGGAVTFTAAFEGTLPIAYQWQVNTGTGLTNIAGQTNSTLVLTNLQASNSGSYSLYATNSVGTGSSTPATLTVHPQPTGPVTVNFQWHSTEGGDAGTYAGAGIPGFGTGTYWNQITGPSAWSPGTYTSSSGLADDGITDIGMSWTLVTGGSWSMTASSTVPLLDSYAISYGTQSFTFDLPNGLYNLVLFSCNGSESATGNSAAAFNIKGVTHTAVPTQHSSFVLGNNYVVFSNVVVTAGTLSGTWSVANGLSFGSLNGAQVNYLGAVNTNRTPITVHASGGQLTLSWPANPGWTLQAQTNTLSTGLGTNWVDVTGSSEATQISLPMNSSNGSVFYRTTLRQ